MSSLMANHIQVDLEYNSKKGGPLFSRSILNLYDLVLLSHRLAKF